MWDNSEILAWYLPFYFTGAAEGKKGKQWKLVKKLEEVRDFVRCFSIYLREVRKLLMRSESSNQKAMMHITAQEEELKKAVGEIVGCSSVEVWDQYNQTAHTREQRPSLPDAIARLVCNDLSLYPILPGVFALYRWRRRTSDRRGTAAPASHDWRRGGKARSRKNGTEGT